METKWDKKLIETHRGTVMVRVSKVMNLFLKRKGIRLTTTKPHRIIIEYCNNKGICVDFSNQRMVRDYCVKLFLDKKTPFYHCGNSTNLSKILKSLSEHTDIPLIIKDKPKLKPINKPRENLTHKEKYRRYLKSAKWKNFKRILIKERGHKCQDCGEKYRPLDGHHITYERLFNELPEDVRLLCHQCHMKEHNMS